MDSQRLLRDARCGLGAGADDSVSPKTINKVTAEITLVKKEHSLLFFVLVFIVMSHLYVYALTYYNS